MKSQWLNLRHLFKSFLLMRLILQAQLVLRIRRHLVLKSLQLLHPLHLCQQPCLKSQHLPQLSIRQQLYQLQVLHEWLCQLPVVHR
jgi:hypothetical protein